MRVITVNNQWEGERVMIARAKSRVDLKVRSKEVVYKEVVM